MRTTLEDNLTIAEGFMTYKYLLFALYFNVNQNIVILMGF